MLKLTTLVYNSPVRKQVLFALAMTLLTGWNHPLIVDDFHTILESIGQIAYHHSGTTPSITPIQNQVFWENNSVIGAWNATMLIDNGNMLVSQMLTHFCVRFFGSSQIYFLGICSIVGFCLTIVATWYLAHMLLGRKTAVWAATLCAVNPTLLVLANSKRSYSIATAFGLIASVLFLKLLELEKRSEYSSRRPNPNLFVLGYAAIALLGFFSHFQLVLVLLAHVIFALTFVRDRITWFRLVNSGFLFIGVVAVWLYFCGGLESIKNYPKLSQYVTYIEKVERVKMYGDFTPSFVVASLLNNLCYVFGYNQLLPGAKVRVVSIFLILPLMLVFLRRRNFRGLDSDRFRAIFFLIACGFVVHLTSLIRTLMTGNLFGLTNVYQSFSIPFIMILIAFVCESSKDQNLIDQPTRLPCMESLRQLATCLIFVSLLLGLVGYTSRFNALINHEPYLDLANSVKKFRTNDKRLVVHVPTLFEAQILSFFAAMDAPIEFVLSDQAKIEPIVAKRMERIGIQSIPLKFYEFQRLKKKPNDNSIEKLMINRYDGRNLTLSW